MQFTIVPGPRRPLCLFSGRRLLALGSLLLTGGLQAAPAPPGSVADAVIRQPETDAYAELAPREAQQAGDPDFDYRFGIAALDAGHVTRAIFALERVVAVRPDDPLARAELGRAYLAAGDTERGREQFDRVRRAAIPAGAAVAIDRVLGALDQVAPSTRARYFGYLEIGAGHDTNATSATNLGQFAIPAFGGLLFKVDPQSGRRSDNFGLAAGGVSVQFPLRPGWDLIGAVNGRGLLNTHVHEQNIGVLDGTAGVRHEKGADVQSLVVQSSATWIAANRYRVASGLNAQWQSQLGAASQASAFAQWSRLDYAGQGERNADRFVIGAGYAHDFATARILTYGSLYFADERVRDGDFDYYGHRAIGLRVGGERKLTDSTVAFGEWQYEYRRYGGTEPLFEARRIDRQNDLIVGVRYQPGPLWQVLPQVRYTRAASNVVLYDYERYVFQVSLRREFR